MSIWKKLAEELDNVEYINLNEAGLLNVHWKPEQITILKSPKDVQQGDGEGGSSNIEVVGQEGQEDQEGQEGQEGQQGQQGQQSQDKQSNKNKKGQKSQDQQASNPKEEDQTGEESGGKEGEDKNKKGEWGKGTGERLKDDINSIDDHSIMANKSDNSKLDDALSEIYDKMVRRSGKKNPDNWQGAAGNMFRDDVKKIVRRRLPMDKIKHELAAFKEEISKKMMDDETYQLSILSGASQGGKSDINRPVEVKDDDRNKQSAILFLCVDTSGSMGDEEFELVYGWAKEIADFFKSDSAGSGGIPGRVFLLEYDTRVYTPIREWKNDKKPKAPRGGGGNAVNCVYKFLNQHFLKEEKRGNLVSNKFVFDEAKPGLFEIDKKKDLYKIEHEIETTYVKDNDRQEQIKKLKTKQFKYGDMLKESFDYANVPFLLFFTDGYDEVPNAFGPLYRNNLGNILYIITSKAWLGNMRPRNFIYCDVHVESFADAFDTDGNIVDSGQGRG